MRRRNITTMFSRESLRLSAWAALIAVAFMVLMPAALKASGLSQPSSASAGMFAICTPAGVKTIAAGGHEAPVEQSAAHQQPCVLCTASVPLFPDANTPRIAGVIEGIPLLLPAYAPERLPRDVVAIQPLSPRAPPRL